MEGLKKFIHESLLQGVILSEEERKENKTLMVCKITSFAVRQRRTRDMWR